ncbi:MAG TPA: ATP-binding protein [Oligoflexus sp.]|uniref:ATP-binding protein n=1 Tax=Oligoflexus sp. TaxID=1971216 RepID=UPI002D47CB91|nr:ATP-binding protein [Oligoflexus sp.]HYX33897.1 ATP-binding protein [Oligoflexus sp.]
MHHGTDSRGLHGYFQVGIAKSVPPPYLIRNSLDHGLEEPEERRRKGKNPKGCIRMEMTLSQETLNILMTDDGRGINLLKVWQRALERNLVHEDESYTAIDVANFILTPGFSTAEKVTDISGRGMGLDAVANYLEKQGGSLELVLEDPRAPHLGIVPLKFLITLPSTHFQVVA